MGYCCHLAAKKSLTDGFSRLTQLWGGGLGGWGPLASVSSEAFAALTLSELTIVLLSQRAALPHLQIKTVLIMARGEGISLLQASCRLSLQQALGKTARLCPALSSHGVLPSR